MTTESCPDPSSEDAALDRLLLEAGPEVPDDFAARVLSGLPQRPDPAGLAPAITRAPRTVWRVLQALALTGTGLLGLSQLLAYLFGVWLATAAG